MIRLNFAGLLVFAVTLVHSSALRADQLFIASWNCENLFDTEDDPNVKGDEEYMPDSPKKWTKEKLDTKLTNLGSIIKKMNDGKGPDVLGVCEVENRKVVEMLVEKLQPLGRKYEIIHKDSPSERGIDCAIVYDSAVFSLPDRKFHFVDAGDTRDIVEAKLRRKDNDLYVFMDHWPSRHHDEAARNKAGDTARKRIDEILATDPKADIIMLGDFNDESTEESIRDHLKTATNVRYHGQNQRSRLGYFLLQGQMGHARPHPHFTWPSRPRRFPMEGRQQRASRISGSVLPAEVRGRPKNTFVELHQE
jgi:hypothetical protein